MIVVEVDPFVTIIHWVCTDKRIGGKEERRIRGKGDRREGL